MNYEKAYKEALEKARQFSEHPMQEDSSSIVEYIFPELKESEDERISKALIRFHKSTIDVDGIKGEDIIAWLEKQGKQKASYTTIVETGDGGINALVKKELPANGCDEQNPTWSAEDMFKVQRICKYLCEAKEYYADISEVRDCIDWLHSLKQRIKGE